MLFYNLLSNKNVIEISIMNQYKEKSILYNFYISRIGFGSTICFDIGNKWI